MFKPTSFCNDIDEWLCGMSCFTQLNRLVVVDTDGHVEGVVSLSDILRRLVLSTTDDSQTTSELGQWLVINIIALVTTVP